MKYNQWHTQNFIMGGVKVLQAPRRVGRGEGVSPSPLGDGSGEGDVPTLKKIFHIFVGKKHILMHSDMCIS